MKNIYLYIGTFFLFIMASCSPKKQDVKSNTPTELKSEVVVERSDWDFTSSKNGFDGTVLIATTKGKTSNDIYRTPLLVIKNEVDKDNIDISFVDAGTWWGSTSIQFYFDNESKVYLSWAEISGDTHTAFLTYFVDTDEKKRYTKNDFINKLKKHSTINVRIKSDHYANDVSFSLKGSAKALNNLKI